MNDIPVKDRNHEKLPGEAQDNQGAPLPEKKDSRDSGKPEKDLSMKLDITVPGEEIERQIDQVASGYSAEIKLPGFRKGNVPLDIIKSRYKQLITDEALNKLIEYHVYEKIQKDKLKIVSRPVVEKIDYQEGNTLQADVTVELFPVITFPDFSGMELKIPEKEFGGESFDEKKEIERVLERNKHRVPVNDRPARENDTVQLTVQSRFLDTKRLTKKQEVTFLVNRESDFEIQGFFDEVVGKKQNDRLILNRSYPSDYKKKNWAGKSLEHVLEIKNIFEMRKAELNADFLKSIGFKDEASFKAKLKEEYDQYVKNQREEKINDVLATELTSKLDFPIPKTLLEQETERMMSQVQPILRTMNDEQKAEYLGVVRKNVEKSVRFSLILEAIQQEFKMEISNDELEKEYKLIAENNKFPLAEVRKYYMNSGEKEKLKDALLRTKVMNFLREKIKIREV
jgi:trigger factor